MTNKKGLKTTIVASIMGLLGVTLFVLWFMDTIDNGKFTMGLAGIGTFGGTILGILTKDASASHSHDVQSTVNPDPPTPPPPPTN